MCVLASLSLAAPTTIPAQKTKFPLALSISIPASTDEQDKQACAAHARSAGVSADVRREIFMNQKSRSSLTRQLISVALLLVLIGSAMQGKAQQWNTTGSLGTARSLHTATPLANGKVL